ncbi:MAG: acyltransferase family protein [Ktedonobacterales bacterium]
MAATTEAAGLPVAATSAARGKHLAYVDGARAVAALYVAFHHSWAIVSSSTVRPSPLPLVAQLYGIVGYGRWAVSAFIAISGFSLMLPIVRGDGQLSGGVLTFFKRRARRILPPYYFSMAFVLVLIWLLIGHHTGTSWDASLPVSKQSLLGHFLLLQDVARNGMYTINGVFWSIAIEWHIYFFFPVLVLLARRLSVAVTMLCAAVAAYAASMVLLVVHVPGYLSYLPDRLSLIVDYLGLFALGMLAAQIAYSSKPAWQAVRRKVPWGLVALAAFIGLVGIFAFVSAGGGVTQQNTINADVLTALFTLALFIAAARSSRSLAALALGWKPLAKVGTFSYSIYLIHAPVIAVVYLYLVRPYLMPAFNLGYPSAVVVLMVIAIPFAVGVSYVFFLFCERPFLNKPRASNSPRVPDAQPASAVIVQAG